MPDNNNEIITVSQMLEIEKKRIESQDKKTEVARQYMELNDADNKRQFDYHMKKLELDHASDERKDTDSRKIAWTILAAIGVLGFVLIGFTFFGSEKQSEIAIKGIIIVLIAIGGGSISNSLKKLLKRIL